MYLKLFTPLMAMLLVFAGALAADELTTTDGDKFVGTFEKLEGGVVYFATDSVGTVEVPADKVETLTLDDEREVRVRLSDDVQVQEDAVLFSRDGELFYRMDGEETEVELGDVKGIDETVPDTRAKWSISALALASWTEGNTETIALGYNFDIKRETDHNFMNLFARGSYLQDRTLEEDSVRERKHHIGYLYRYIFDFRLTIDFTQDFYFNELAGYNYRSVTGLGPGYYILLEDKLSWHVGAQITYTIEDQIGGAEDRYYWGARAATEFDYVSSNDRFHINYKGQLLFDFDEFKNLQANQSLLVEYSFLQYFKAGVLVEHSWDNLPPPGFEHNDFRLTLTLGFSWSGRWV